MSLLYTQIGTFNDLLDLSNLDLQTIQRSAEDFENYDVPTLFITEEQDVIFPPVMIRLASEMVPGAALRVLKEAGHSSYF